MLRYAVQCYAMVCDMVLYHSILYVRYVTYTYMPYPAWLACLPDPARQAAAAKEEAYYTYTYNNNC